MEKTKEKIFEEALDAFDELSRISVGETIGQVDEKHFNDVCDSIMEDQLHGAKNWSLVLKNLIDNGATIEQLKFMCEDIINIKWKGAKDEKE